MSEYFSGAGLWDYVVLDEGHVIKNQSTKMSKAVHMLNTKHRLLLTGTITYTVHLS
jgi:SNF2 family DNA or RNA helicase